MNRAWAAALAAVCVLAVAACGGHAEPEAKPKSAPGPGAVRTTDAQKQFLTIQAVGPSETADSRWLSGPRERAPSTPAVIAAAEEEKAAQSAVDVARSERWPVPAVSLGRTATANPFGAANFLGLSVELMVFDSRRGPLAKAQSEATAAGLRRELAQAEAAATLERHANVIAAREVALQRFDREAASRLAQLREMSENAYRLGRSSIFELLDSTRSRHELQQARIELVALLLEAQVRFLATSGTLDQAVGGSGALLQR